MTQQIDVAAQNQINAQVAEHVAGWMAVGKRRRGVKGATFDEDVWQGVPARDDILRDIPNYCGSRDEALRLLEAVFPWPKFYTCIRTVDTGNWRCDIELHGGDGPTASASDPSIPMAICKAMLEAKERGA